MQLCPAWMEPAKPQGCRVSGAAAGASREPRPRLLGLCCSRSSLPLGASKRVDGGDALMARKGSFPIAGWGAMVFEKVRQSPEAEQPCLKGAGFVVYSGVLEALSLCHNLAWPL